MDEEGDSAVLGVVCRCKSLELSVAEIAMSHVTDPSGIRRVSFMNAKWGTHRADLD